MKEYMWYSKRKRSLEFSVICGFIEFIRELETGKIKSIYSPKSDIGIITPGKMQAYLKHLESNFEDNTIVSRTWIVRTFIKQYGELHREINVDALLRFFSHTNSFKENNAKCLNDDEIVKLMKAIDHMDLDERDTLCSIVVRLLIGTEMRISQILALKIDSIQESHRKNAFVIISKTKTTSDEMVRTPITRRTYEMLMHARSISDKYRNATSERMSDYIFIVNSKKQRNQIIHLTKEVVNEFLAKCSKSAGIWKVTCSNLRDTYMTSVATKKINDNISELNANILTGHKSSKVDREHYIDQEVSIKAVVETTHSIIIGNVDLVGNVTNEESRYGDERMVEHQCGYCNMDACDITSTLGCLVCKNFVTMPSRIPYFEKYICFLDNKISNTTIIHDKEDLVNIKRLVAGYLVELYKKKN